MLHCRRQLCTENLPAGNLKAALGGGKGGGPFYGGLDGAEVVRAATEGNLLPVMPQGNLVEALSCERRRGLPGELMLESSPSTQRRPTCKTNKEMSDEAADAAALTYFLTSNIRIWSSSNWRTCSWNYY